MKTFKKLIVGIAALSLAACSGKGGNSTTTPAATSEATTEPSAETSSGYKTTFTYAVGGEPT